jgi:UDP-glucuronate 4-epimerase
MNILITGVAGFIGYYTAKALLEKGVSVTGIDNLNAYYDPALKRSRLAQLEHHRGFRFIEADIAGREAMTALFDRQRYNRVIHLAAQAGVRYSLENPHAYIESNVTGFLNILEGCRRQETAHLVFASSSSVYGANADTPFSEHRGANHPVSLYGATKKSNEMMAHAYAHLFGLPVTGLRFFTVYGPWGRPDMSPFLFTRKILAGEPIDVFNYGNHWRDFTYVTDIAEGVVRVSDAVPAANPEWDNTAPDPATSPAPYRIYNIGNNNPVQLMDFIGCIEEATGKTAKINLLPLQPGDVLTTCANVDALQQATGFKPETPIAEGVGRFVEWYRGYYGV